MTDARGMSLIESVVALVIIGVAATSILTAFMTMVHSNTRSGELSHAVSAAEMELEDLRLQDPELLPSTGSSSPRLVVVGDRQYEVVTHYCERAELCQDTTRHIRVEVRLQGESIYDVKTVYTQLR